MITKKELEEYARLKGLSLGNAEKDYMIDIALLSISKNTKNELIFKGGTCLYKFHQLDRFSEDLDFSAVSEIDVNKIIEKIISDFKNFGIKVSEHRKREPFNSILITLRIEGPLFFGKPQGYANLGIDINFKSAVLLQPELLSYRSLYQEIPIVSSLCMQPKEIFAEKIRAIITRRRARDLFDLYFLMQKGIYAEQSIISKKMEYYNKKFDLKELINRISQLEQYWKKELAGFVQVLPDFNKVKKEVIEKLKTVYK